MKLKLVSEDSRRRLYEFGEGKEWKICKYLEIKDNCTIGDHYHLLKDELFLVIKGSVNYTIGEDSGVSTAGDIIDVPAGVRHTLYCTKGTILVCLATELHNSKDDNT